MRKLNETYISPGFNDLYNLDIYKYCFFNTDSNTIIVNVLNKIKNNQIVEFDVYILYLYAKLCQHFIKLCRIKYIKNTDKIEHAADLIQSNILSSTTNTINIDDDEFKQIYKDIKSLINRLENCFFRLSTGNFNYNINTNSLNHYNTNHEFLSFESSAIQANYILPPNFLQKFKIQTDSSKLSNLEEQLNNLKDNYNYDGSEYNMIASFTPDGLPQYFYQLDRAKKIFIRTFDVNSNRRYLNELKKHYTTLYKDFNDSLIFLNYKNYKIPFLPYNYIKQLYNKLSSSLDKQYNNIIIDYTIHDIIQNKLYNENNTLYTFIKNKNTNIYNNSNKSPQPIDFQNILKNLYTVNIYKILNEIEEWCYYYETLRANVIGKVTNIFNSQCINNTNLMKRYVIYKNTELFKEKQELLLERKNKKNFNLLLQLNAMISMLYTYYNFILKESEILYNFSKKPNSTELYKKYINNIDTIEKYKNKCEYIQKLHDTFNK